MGADGRPCRLLGSAPPRRRATGPNGCARSPVEVPTPLGESAGVSVEAANLRDVTGPPVLDVATFDVDGVVSPVHGHTPLDDQIAGNVFGPARVSAGPGRTALLARGSGNASTARG